jgi:uncharacterized membrane protein
MYPPLNRKGRFVYQLAMTCVLCLGSILMIVIISLWLPVLEVDLNAKPSEIDSFLFSLFIIGLILSCVIGYSIGLFLIMLFLVLIKQLSFDEAIRLTFKREFPNHWLK